MCNKVSSCGPNGEYDKIIKACKCRSGWTGSDCSKDTTPITLTRSSFIEYQSSAAIEYFHTEIQLRFRTRYDGELVRVSYGDDQEEFEVLEVSEGILGYRYKIDYEEERDIALKYVYVDDGEWHTARLTRYGSAVILSIDGGEGRRYNQLFSSNNYQKVGSVKSSVVHVGGNMKKGRYGSFKIKSDFRGCMDDIQLNKQPLSYLPSQLTNSNTTETYQPVAHQNIREGCHSNNPCNRVTCPHSYMCVDLWWEYECR